MYMVAIKILGALLLGTILLTKEGTLMNALLESTKYYIFSWMFFLFIYCCIYGVCIVLWIGNKEIDLYSCLSDNKWILQSIIYAACILYVFFKGKL